MLLPLLLAVFSPVVALAQGTCKTPFVVAKYDGKLLAYGQMSDAQQKWWEHKGHKEFKAACVAPDGPKYFIVWGAEVQQRAGFTFLYVPGQSSTTTISGDVNATAVTTSPGQLETVPTERSVTDIHVYVLEWNDGKVTGPLWMKERAGEGWIERSWGQRHPASQELLEEALKFISKSE